MEEEEDIEPLRISLGNGTYATKVRGILVMVRNKKPETAFEISMDLLGEAFRGPLRSPKSKKGSPTFEDCQTSQFQQHPLNSFPMNQHAADGCVQPTMMDPSQSESQSANFGPGPEVTMGPHGYGPHPRPRYGYGNRQLALMPIGGPQSMSPNQNPYSQPWMYPQGQMSGFPSYGTGGNGNPLQSFANQWAANIPTAYNFTVTRHICANCGKLRSRKYQAENPIVAGELPVPAFCRKCQKDASSTDDESNGSVNDGRGSKKGTKSKSKGKEKDKKKGSKKCRGDCDAGSSKESLLSEDQNAFASWKSGKERLQEDYILVQDHEDSEPGLRRSTLRINIHDEPKDKRGLAPPSPLVQQVFDLRSSTNDLSNGSRRILRERSPSPRRVFITERDTTRRHSFVEPPSTSRRPSSRDTIRQAVTEEEFDNFYRGRSQDSPIKCDEFEGEKRGRMRRIDEEGREPCRSPTRREHFIEERSTDAASIRAGPRRYERGIEAPLSHVRSRLPHNIGPLKDDEIVVVTERYVYRPRRLESVREENHYKSRHQEEIHDFRRQKQHHIDSITLGTNRQYQRFGAESEASEYYTNDWNYERPHQQREEVSCQRVRPKDLVDDFRPSSQDPDNLFDVRRQVSAEASYLPRAPSPPAPGRLIGENHAENMAKSSAHAATHSLVDEGVTSKPRKCKSTERRRTRKSSYRPPYVREGTEGGTEQALVHSPGHSRERRFISEEISDGTEEIERTDARRVQFREPEIRDAWSAASATSVDDMNANEWAPVGGSDRW